MVAPTPIGVVVVKISLGDLEQAWSEGADRVALADADGIVFLSSESNWRYRTLAPLTADTQKDCYRRASTATPSCGRFPFVHRGPRGAA